MPRKEKKQGNFNYVPLHENDLKHSIEIPVKQIEENSLIRVEKAGKSKGKARIELKEKHMKEETETEEPKTKEKYVLIITEKPQAALKIASALGNCRKYSESNVPYYKLERNKKEIIVACAVGHLFTLSSKEKGFPVFNIEWQPNFKVKKADFTKKYYSLLAKLCKNASEIILATDYDVEGEVIGWNIIRFIAKSEKAKRMKFSTLTKDELESSYENLMPEIDFSNAYAGETRHFLDWMYGINLSRALMSAIKKAGKFRIMSIGRVQGPALSLIVEKELEIKKFKPMPYWQVFIKLKNHAAELKYEKDITKNQDLAQFKKLEGKKGIAVTEKFRRKIPPNFPFDLTSLQREAYNFFKINPARTLQIAQTLYLAGLISYPRTSSQKIPEAIQPLKILKKLPPELTEFAIRAKPVEGKKFDAAHPSIYPTGEKADLSGEEEKIYSLIMKRFIACFCEDAEIEDKKITFSCESKNYKASGLSILNKAWMNVYPSYFKEAEIETIEGEKIIEKSRIEEKETQPPRRYTPASIITELERKNLGTKATRSAIVETLYNRGYVKEQSIEATPLGIILISSLKKYSPIIIDENLTREFEREMQEIQASKKNLEEKQARTIERARQAIIIISEDFKTNEEKIGKELVKANEENYKQERGANTLNSCPVCKKGNLRILLNKNSRRYFLGCSNYPECKTTFSLPPNCLIKPAGKTCEFCSFPKLLAIRKAKRPWEFCFNPECKSNKERVENYKNNK